MSYVARSLGPGEIVVYVAHLSWVTYFWAFALAAVGVFTSFFAPIIGAALLVVAFIWFLFVRFYNSTIELAVTNHKVVAKTGFISRKTIEQRLEKIDAIDVEQSILGRILNFGNVTITGTGISSTPFKLISSPLTFRRKVEQAIEAKQVLTQAVVEPKREVL